MNDPVNYWDPTGHVPEALTDENRAAVTNFNDFHRQEERDDRLETWEYSYQEDSYYSDLDDEKLNYKETQTSSAKTITWSQMLYEEWTYDGELIGYFDEDGLGHPDAGGTKEQVFYQFTENDYEMTITAEDMLKTNLEWLLQHGNVPVSQYKTGSSTMTFDEVHEQYPSVFEKGRFDSDSFNELVNLSQAKTNYESIQRLEARESQALKSLDRQDSGPMTLDDVRTMNRGDYHQVINQAGQEYSQEEGSVTLEDAVMPTYNFFIGDDLATLTDGNWNGYDLLAVASITPAGKVVKAGKKLNAFGSSSNKVGKGTRYDGVRIINKKYAGKTYNLSGDLAKKYPNGVKFTNDGFPDFSPYSKTKVKVDGLKGNTTGDFTAANKAAGLKKTPSGHTWHHVEDGKTLMLVPTDLHQAVRHTGGAALIRKGLAP